MKPQEKKRGAFLKFLFLTLLVFIILAIFLFVSIVIVVSEYSKELPKVEKLKEFKPSESSRIFASNGTLIRVLYSENHVWISIKEIPQDMQDAIVAIEDARFYEHKGIDPRGILGAICENFKGRSLSQGASTITQQLARNIFLNQEPTFKRKMQEILISLKIEKEFSKKEILELYLNQIYFGAGAYGIEAAADIYFKKHAKDLTLAECAVIAGLPAAPSAYSPFVDREGAATRQKLVLERMTAYGYITPEEEKRALHTKLKYAPRRSELQMLKYPYFTTYVLTELSKKYSNDLLYRGGLKIYTTINISMQKAAETALSNGINKAKREKLNVKNGAIVAIEPRSGHIKAMVGGLNYNEKNQFNRAWQARRQAGSAFNVFVFTAAIDLGFNPDSLIEDSPVTFPIRGSVPWTPKNSDNSYLGTMRFRDALKWSRNVCAVKILNKIGIDTVIEYAHRMGINDVLEHNFTIALGSCGVTPLDMASAFGVLASGGIRYESTSIEYILDTRGKVLTDHRKPQGKEILAESTAYTMTEMLEEVIKSGTGTAAQIGRPAAGKTGTTDQFRDAWFVGYAPQLSCAVWIGNDDNSKMNRVYGGALAAPIWAEFMKKALSKKKKLAFSSNEKGEIGIIMCEEAKMRATGSCPVTAKKFFTAGDIPRRFCTKHRFVKPFNKPTVKSPSPAKQSEPRADLPSPEQNIPSAGPSTPRQSRKTPQEGKSQSKKPPMDIPNTVAPTLEPGFDIPHSHSTPMEIEKTPTPMETEEDMDDIVPPSIFEETTEPQNTPGNQQL